MAKERQEPRFHYAPPGTLAGKLQRGLGSGFLEALRTPKEVLHPLLMECIQTDPALDIHLDHRDWYYGELASQTGLDITELGESLIDLASDEDEETNLALEVLAHMAKRGNQQADLILRDYVKWGPRWQHVLLTLDTFATSPEWTALSSTIARRAAADTDHLPLFSDPFETWAKTDPGIAALTDLTPPQTYRRRRSESARRLRRQSTASLLMPARGATTPQIRELATRDSAEDMALIEVATSDSVPMIRATALAAQFERGDFRHFDQCLEMAVVEQRPPAASGIARRAVLRAPADDLMPLARKWKSSGIWYRRNLAFEVFELHATEEDLPWLESSLMRASASDPSERFIVTDLAEVIAGRFPGREFPALRRKFDAFTYSYGRHFLAEALAVTDPSFPTTRAFTSLWDCEDNVRVIAAEHVSLEVPGVVERLREMASDALEEDSRIRKAVEQRLGATS